MKKISTLFLKDPNDLSRVTSEVDPQNAWVFETGIATRKWDGTACMVQNGELYKRYDVKRGKSVPDGAIPCQEADPVTGHWPHWVKCDRSNPSDKYHFEAFDLYDTLPDGTYELIGPKINGNNEKFEYHHLLMHGIHIIETPEINRDWIIETLTVLDIEGIVFHDTLPTGRMCKIRKCDFGIKRNT